MKLLLNINKYQIILEILYNLNITAVDDIKFQFLLTSYLALSSCEFYLEKFILEKFHVSFKNKIRFEISFL
jgi:hypothetical protein